MLPYLEGPGLAGNELEQLTDRHPRGEAVRVHDDVRAQALIGERHVLLVDDEPADPLLAVPAAELVAELRGPGAPDPRLDDQEVVGVGRDHDSVDVSVRALRPCRREFYNL